MHIVYANRWKLVKSHARRMGLADNYLRAAYAKSDA